MAIQLDALRAFVKVAELASFTHAGEHLGLSKARVSVLVRELETELGSLLLQRSTRTVGLTADGAQMLVRARRLVADADELGSLFHTPSAVRGVVRIDVPQELARTLLIPRLPEFFALHPHIELMLSTTDRRVDILRDGFDCVLRIGKLRDSGLIARTLGSFSMMNYASAGYVAKYGTPCSVEALKAHVLVHYALKFGSERPTFEYFDGNAYCQQEMRSIVTVNSTDAYLAACIAGLGIIQAPRMSKLPLVTAGSIVEILPEYPAEPMPVSLVHGYTRNVPKHVRAVLTWLSLQLKHVLDSPSA